MTCNILSIGMFSCVGGVLSAPLVSFRIQWRAIFFQLVCFHESVACYSTPLTHENIPVERIWHVTDFWNLPMVQLARHWAVLVQQLSLKAHVLRSDNVSYEAGHVAGCQSNVLSWAIIGWRQFLYICHQRDSCKVPWMMCVHTRHK